jgi:hypothetical protein
MACPLRIRDQNAIARCDFLSFSHTYKGSCRTDWLIAHKFWKNTDQIQLFTPLNARCYIGARVKTLAPTAMGLDDFMTRKNKVDIADLATTFHHTNSFAFCQRFCGDQNLVAFRVLHKHTVLRRHNQTFSWHTKAKGVGLKFNRFVARIIAF